MLDVVITEAKMRHAGPMIRRLRREHALAFAAIGLNSHQELRNTMAASSYRRAGFLNGELAALWGVTGSLLSATGFVWLCLSNEAARHPMLILRGAKRQLDEIMETKTELATTVLRDDEAALRFCVYLGFHVGHDGDGAPATSKWGRRTLIEYVRTNPDIRLPAGRSWVMPMGYHPAEVN